jgi:hypothetical protein
MAERRPVRGDSDSDDREQQVGTGRGRTKQLTAAEAGRFGLRQIAELTEKAPEGVSGVEPAEDGWVVTVDVIEDHRIPSAADILATYEAEVGLDGELISYRRIRRYARGRGDDRNA